MYGGSSVRRNAVRDRNVGPRLCQRNRNSPSDTLRAAWTRATLPKRFVMISFHSRDVLLALSIPLF